MLAYRWIERARRLKSELYALYLSARHPRTPWYARLVVAGAVAYAVTPADLFPDAFPILGVVDDLVFVPLAVALAMKFVPAAVLAECRALAEQRIARVSKPIPWLPMLAVWVASTAVAVAAYL